MRLDEILLELSDPNTIIYYYDDDDDEEDDDLDFDFEIEGDLDLLDDDEVLDEVLRRGWAVRGKKKVRVKVSKRRAGRMSPKQKIALRKARRKSKRAGAKRKRKISVRKRQRLGVKKIKGGSRPKRRQRG